MQGRVKGSALRRPQSRAARQQAAQRSMGDKYETPGRDVPGSNPSVSAAVLPPPDKSSQTRISPTLPNSGASPSPPAPLPSHSPPSQIPARPSELALPVSTNTGYKDTRKDTGTSKLLPSFDEDDLFGSDSLFGVNSVTNKPSTRETTKTSLPQASSRVAIKKDKDKSTFPSIFDDNTDDLFQNIKPRTTTKTPMASSFLEDDDNDIFGLSNNSTPSSTSSKEIKSNSSLSQQDIFQVTLFL